MSRVIENTVFSKRPRHLAKLAGAVSGDMLSLNDRGDASPVANPDATKVAPEIIGNTFTGTHLNFPGKVISEGESVCWGKIRMPENFNISGELIVELSGMFYEGNAAPLPVAIWVTVNATGLNDICKPTTGDNGFFYMATDIGVGPTHDTGIAEPVWPVTAGGTIVDGDVTWTAIQKCEIETWEANAVIVLGEIRKPTTDVNGMYFICHARALTNTTGAVEPATFATAVAGDHIIDHDITWLAIDYTEVNFNVKYGVVNDGDLVKATPTMATTISGTVDAPILPGTDDFPFMTLEAIIDVNSLTGITAGSYLHYYINRFGASSYGQTSDFFVTDITFKIPVK